VKLTDLLLADLLICLKTPLNQKYATSHSRNQGCGDIPAINHLDKVIRVIWIRRIWTKMKEIRSDPSLSILNALCTVTAQYRSTDLQKSVEDDRKW